MRSQAAEFEGLKIRFFIFLTILILLGLTMVWSSSFIFAAEAYGNSQYFFYKQLLYLAASLVLFWVVSQSKVNFWIKYGVFFHIACVFLLFLTLVPGLGLSAKGANRWLGLGGPSFQPSEFVKISIIFVSLPLFEKFGSLRFGQKALYGGLIIAAFIPLIFQPDFGTLFIAFLVLSFVAFLSSFSRKYLSSLVAGGFLLIIPILLSEDYRVERMFSFLDPWKTPKTSGFQVIQSYLAFANGSITGQGVGNSNGKLFYLPEAHNDFIFSVIGEEWGLVGVTFVIGTFLFLLYYGFLIALRLNDRKSHILVSSVMFTIGLQAIFNMGVVLGLLPTKGLNLPFVSAGGSSLLGNFFAIGILFAAVRNEAKKVTNGDSGSNLRANPI